MGVVHEAGAIPLRRVNQEWQVLLVTPKNNPSVWIFPKGHIEPGENALATALREVFEEAGIHGQPIGPAGMLELRQGTDTIRVQYYLVHTEDPGTPEPGRSLIWLPYEAALARLSFDDSRSLLRNSWPSVPMD